jgi:hypothetical protein
MPFSMRCFLPATVLAALSGAALTGAASAQSIQSAYTKHDYETCKVISDEEPVTERQCTGHAGIAVNWTNEPDASSLDFGKDGLIGELGREFSFAVAGETIEWRGPMQGGAIVPFAAIVRYQLCGAIGGPCRPALVLYRLNGNESSCIAGIVEAKRKDANERARRMADSAVAGFRCGKDKRRAG